MGQTGHSLYFPWDQVKYVHYYSEERPIHSFSVSSESLSEVWIKNLTFKNNNIQIYDAIIWLQALAYPEKFYVDANVS